MGTFPIAEVAALIAAFGGGTTVQVVLSALSARRSGARTRESEQQAAIVAEIDRARNHARKLEERLEQMTHNRNNWREYGHQMFFYLNSHCGPAGPDLPVRPSGPDPI